MHDAQVSTGRVTQYSVTIFTEPQETEKCFGRVNCKNNRVIVCIEVS